LKLKAERPEGFLLWPLLSDPNMVLREKNESNTEAQRSKNLPVYGERIPR